MSEAEEINHDKYQQIRDLLKSIADEPVPAMTDFLRTVLTTGPRLVGHAVLIVNLDGRILYASEILEGMTGHNARAVVGEYMEILVPDRYVAQHRAAFVRFAETRDKTALTFVGRLLPFKCSDGSEVELSVSFDVLGLLDQELVVASIHPVTKINLPVVENA